MVNKKIPVVIEGWKLCCQDGQGYSLEGYVVEHVAPSEASIRQIQTSIVTSVGGFTVETLSGDTYILGEPGPEFESRLKTMNPRCNPGLFAVYVLKRLLGQPLKNTFQNIISR